MRSTGSGNDKYPTTADLRLKAKGRIPFFAFEYLDSATGREEAAARNIEALKNVTLEPRFMQGAYEPDIKTTLFGRSYDAPIGVSPIGMSSLMWPGAEAILARAAAEKNIPYCLSTVAADAPENIGPLAKGNGWFQLYPPRKPEIREDLIKRAMESGFSALVLTVDVPVPSMRERQRKAGLSMPPKINPTFIWRVATRPLWALATLKRGQPRFLGLEKYASTHDMREVAAFVGRELGGTLDWDYVKEVRKLWDGPFILKGILSPSDAKRAVELGVDGVWVSNHGGRQFDGAPAAVDCVAPIKKAIPKTPLLFDSGIRSGLDIARALSMGADFCFAGRPFIYGVAALGESGGTQTADMFSDDLKNVMSQLGAKTLADLRSA